MALKFSTGLRDAILGRQGVVGAVRGGTTLAFVDGGAGSDTITDSGSGLVTAGFVPGLPIYIYGPNTAANKTQVDGVVLTAVTAGALTFSTGIVNTAESFLTGTCVIQPYGGSFKDIFKHGVIRIYSGSQPSDADQAESGTHLLTITVDSGSFGAGSAANGLIFGEAEGGELVKGSSTWSGKGLSGASTGTSAGWFRFYDNSYTTGASLSAIRFDGTVSTVSGTGVLVMSSTTIVYNATTTIDSFTMSLNASNA
jgi:hypothetical protein